MTPFRSLFLGVISPVRYNNQRDLLSAPILGAKPLGSAYCSRYGELKVLSDDSPRIFMKSLTTSVCLLDSN